MTFKDTIFSARILGLFWVLVSIGSCAVVQVDNRQFYTLHMDLQPEELGPRCKPFEHRQRMHHTRPHPPAVDPSKLSKDEFAEILMSYTEEMSEYLDQEERFLREDIARHNETCK